MSKRKRVAEEVKQGKPTQEQPLSASANDLAQDTVDVALESLEANIGYGSLLRELQHAYMERVAYYRSKMGGSLSLEEARANAYHACKDEEEAKRIYDEMMSYPLDCLDFVDLYKCGPSLLVSPKEFGRR